MSFCGSFTMVASVSSFSKITKVGVLGLGLVSLAACSATPPRPTLYPNDQLTRKGPYASQADIDECERRAQSYVGTRTGGDTAKDVALGAGEGAVVGASVGAIGGVVTKGKVGRTTAAGAAIGGLLGAYDAAKDSNKPDPKYVAFVNNCLEEKGYRVLGWE